VPFEFEPGSAYDYSDITADVMPHLIERATGRRYAQYLGDAILKPLRAPGGRITGADAVTNSCRGRAPRRPPGSNLRPRLTINNKRKPGR